MTTENSNLLVMLEISASSLPPVSMKRGRQPVKIISASTYGSDTGWVFTGLEAALDKRQNLNVSLRITPTQRSCSLISKLLAQLKKRKRLSFLFSNQGRTSL